MNRKFTALDVATAYRRSFNDQTGSWLACYRGVKQVLCRCLDEVQLNTIMLWLGKPTIKIGVLINLSKPYIIEMKHTDTSAIVWCKWRHDLKFVDPSNSNESLLKGWYLGEDGSKLLLFVLLLYYANTTMQRSSIVKYYFFSNWNGFRIYLENLSSYLKSSKSDLSGLEEHLTLIKEVLAWFNQETDIDTLKTDVMEIFAKYVTTSLAFDFPTRMYILTSLNETFATLFDRGTVYINGHVLEKIFNIAKGIKEKDEALWKQCKHCFVEISSSLEGIVKRNLRAGDAELNAYLDGIKKLLS